MTVVAKLDADKEKSVVVVSKDKKSELIPVVKKTDGDKKKKSKELATADTAVLLNPWGYDPNAFSPVALNTLKMRKEIDPKERVLINGKFVEPVESKVTPIGNSVRWKDHSFYANYHYNIPADALFAIYEIKNPAGQVTILFLDQWSYFEYTEDQLFFNRENEGKLLLINSFVKNTAWNGTADFVNVHVENSSARDTSFMATRDRAGFSWDYYDEFHYGSTNRDSNKWDAKYSVRHVYKEVRARQSNFIDSVVSPGSYNGCTIESSTLTVNGRVDLNTCGYHNTTVRAGTLDSEHAQLRRCNFSATGKALISNIRTESKIINSVDTLFLDSKFALTTISSPSYEDIMMLRVSENHYVLQRGGYYGAPVVLNSSDTEEELKIHIKDFVSTFEFNRKPNGHHSKVTPDNIFFNSVTDFIYDTVVSRFKMISVLESARDLGRAVYFPITSHVYSD